VGRRAGLCGRGGGVGSRPKPSETEAGPAHHCSGSSRFSHGEGSFGGLARRSTRLAARPEGGLVRGGSLLGGSCYATGRLRGGRFGQLARAGLRARVAGGVRVAQRAPTLGAMVRRAFGSVGWITGFLHRCLLAMRVGTAGASLGAPEAVDESARGRRGLLWRAACAPGGAEPGRGQAPGLQGAAAGLVRLRARSSPEDGGGGGECRTHGGRSLSPVGSPARRLLGPPRGEAGGSLRWGGRRVGAPCGASHPGIGSFGRSGSRRC